MKLREIVLFIMGFNAFMFLFAYIGMPGMDAMSSFHSAAYYITWFGVGMVVGIIAGIGILAIANNWRLLPVPNERSGMLMLAASTFTATLTSGTAMLNGLLISLGLQAAMPLVVIIALFVGLVLLFTLFQWVLGGGEVIQ